MQSGEDGTTRTICLSHNADDGRGEGFQLFRVEIRDKKKGKDLFIFWVLSFTLITHRPTAAAAAAMVLTCLTDTLDSSLQSPPTPRSALLSADVSAVRD
jgi:hypothetical protein